MNKNHALYSISGIILVISILILLYDYKLINFYKKQEYYKKILFDRDIIHIPKSRINC